MKLETLLKDYFETELSEGKIDFCVRAEKLADGSLEIYIRPDSKNGKTFDFKFPKETLCPACTHGEFPHRNCILR